MGTTASSGQNGITEVVGTKQLILSGDSVEAAAGKACEMLLGKIDLDKFPNTRVITNEIDGEKLRALLNGEIDSFGVKTDGDQFEKHIYEH